jgi:hypothetical protein
MTYSPTAGPPSPTATPQTDPLPPPTPGEVGAALGPPDASTTALVDSSVDDASTPLESAGALPLVSAIQDNFSNAPNSSSQDDSGNRAPAPSTSPSYPYVGQAVDPYTNMPVDSSPSSGNSNAQNPDSLDDLLKSLTADEHSQYWAQTDTAPSYTNNAAPPTATDATQASAPSPTSTNFNPNTYFNGQPYDTTQYTTPGGQQFTEFDTYNPATGFELVAIPTDASQNASAAVTPNAATTSSPNATSGPSPAAPSTTPNNGGGPGPSSNNGPPGPNPNNYDPMQDRWFAKWLLYGNDTPIRDALTNDSNLQTAQNAAAVVGVGAALAAGALAAAPAVVAAYTEMGMTVASRYPVAAAIAVAVGAGMSNSSSPSWNVSSGVQAMTHELDSLAPEIENALPELADDLVTPIHNVVEDVAQQTSTVAENVANTSKGVAQNIANRIPTGPSFEGLIDNEEFSQAPEVIDRLSRARQFDIGGYFDLTGRGQFGRPFDNLDSDEALQNAFIRMTQNVSRTSSVTRNNPAMALTPQLHHTISNMTQAQMQGLTPQQVLQAHTNQMRSFVPDFAVNTLEAESQRFIESIFGPSK